MNRHTIPPLLSLFFLSPLIAEMLSGSSPPSQWASLFSFFFMVCLYGAGAILVRELFIRWRTGMAGLLLLGAAYGVVEEGLDVMSFFNPGWPDLGADAVYGRAAGVNWVWSVHLTMFHAVFSIAIPILLVHLMFPQARGERWLGKRGQAGVGVLFTLVVAGGNILFRSAYHYSPPGLPYIGAILAVALLVYAARRRHAARPAQAPHRKPLRRPLAYFLAGFGLTVGLFLIGWGLPGTSISPVITILLLTGVGGLAYAVAAVGERAGAGFTDGRKLALAAGGLAFFILLTPITASRGIDPATGENFQGMTFVGLAAAVYLLALALIIRQRERKSACEGVCSPPAGPGAEVRLPFGSDSQTIDSKPPPYRSNIGWE
jgi:hypothetical protein